MPEFSEPTLPVTQPYQIYYPGYSGGSLDRGSRIFSPTGPLGTSTPSGGAAVLPWGRQPSTIGQRPTFNPPPSPPVNRGNPFLGARGSYAAGDNPFAGATGSFAGGGTPGVSQNMRPDTEGVSENMVGSSNRYVGGSLGEDVWNPNRFEGTQATAQPPNFLAGLASLFRGNPTAPGPYAGNGLDPNQNFALGYTPQEIQSISQGYTNNLIAGGVGGMAGIGNLPSGTNQAQFNAHQRGLTYDQSQRGASSLPFAQADELTMGPNRQIGGALAGVSPKQFQNEYFSGGARGTGGGRR